MINFNQNQGFTLIELLAVVAIIGFLSVGILMVTSTQFGRARDATRIADLKDTQVYLERYYIDNSAQYPSDMGGFSAMASALNTEYSEYDPTTSDPKGLQYTYQLTSDGYCLCAEFESKGEKANSSNDSCNFAAEADSSYYCLVNKQ